ncbi:MAG: hypothetical protein O7E52_01025 [Candidatus Poribacteria bacterium]|nr:hypothetical protein [Candidatus Poribacteria bacterium]
MKYEREGSSPAVEAGSQSPTGIPFGHNPAKRGDRMQAVQFADSITKLGPQFRGTVLVAGSHGGRYCGYLAALAGLRGVIFNDAGVGKDRAGIGALDYLQPLGVAAATVAHTSARIGDGADMLDRGRLSYCNEAAGALGCSPGQTCREAAEAMRRGKPFKGNPPTHEEGRELLRHEPVRIIACDSASLVETGDADAIIVTGSHGGVLAGRPGYGIAVQARGAVFNDAGVGIDQAGIQRLEILDRAAIPAATVAHESARIGDARSAWESGIISHINTQAAKRGATVGMTVPAFAELLIP